jgi:hypothetical protein
MEIHYLKDNKTKKNVPTKGFVENFKEIKWKWVDLILDYSNFNVFFQFDLFRIDKSKREF